MSIKLLEDNQDERAYSTYTDYQEGQIAISKYNLDGELTSFKKASDLLHTGKGILEYKICYRVVKLMKTNPRIKKYYWLYSTREMESLD